MLFEIEDKLMPLNGFTFDPHMFDHINQRIKMALNTDL